MNIITADFKNKYTAIVVEHRYQWDYGQILKFAGISDLPPAYEVDFSVREDFGEAITQIGTPSDGVPIPDELLKVGKTIYAYLYLHNQDDDGRTRYKVKIPVMKRSKPVDIEVTPEQQNTIDAAIAAFQEAANPLPEAARKAEAAIHTYPKIIDGNWYMWDVDQEAFVDTGIPATGDTGIGISRIIQNSDFTLTVTLTDGSTYRTEPVKGEQGERGYKGDKGDTGNGIQSAVLNPDYTLTLNFTDGTYYTTRSIRGEKGEKGDQGIQGIQGEQGLKGDKGDVGVGITSITNNADYTITISLDDGTSYTTQPIRGEKGEKGEQGIQGVKGDTGAKGDQGIQGIQGAQGVKGETGNGILSTVLNNDYTLTIIFTDGTSYTTPAIRGAKGETGEQGQQGIQGIQGVKGDKGDTGTGISSVKMNQDYTMTVNLDDGTSMTTPPLKGEKGADGAVSIDTTLTQSDYAADAKVVGDELSSIKSDLSDKAPAITNTASGSIAHFEDGSDANAKSVIAHIEPVQDLHGYDSPWPAGGGKNKFDVNKIPDSTFITINNGSIIVDGYSRNCTKRLSEISDLIAGETYILTASTTATSVSFIYLYGSGTTWYFGSNRTVTQEDLNSFVYFYADSNTVATITNFMIRPSSVTDASFTPYSNICPISGFTGMNVVRTGKNLFNINRVQGTPIPSTLLESPRTMEINKWYKGLRADNYYYSGYANCTIENNVLTVHTFTNVNYGIGFPISCKPNTTYTISAEQTGCIFSVGCYDKDWNFLSRLMGVTTYVGPLSFTTPNNAEYITVVIGSVVDGEGTATNIQLELGSTATAYEPYQGETYPITFPSSAGTVYGGYVDPVNGKLVVDRAMDIVNDTSEMYDNGSLAYGAVQLRYVPKQTKKPASLLPYEGLMSDMYLPYNGGKCSINGRAANGYIYFNMPQGVNTIELAKAWFGNNPTQVSYLLATPITYDLTPQQIELLTGVNNVWNDCNGSTDVEYNADTKLYIEQLTKPTEDDMVANSNIASGIFFMVGGNRLFLSTASIAIGETIVPGTNCTELSLADALNNLNA